MRSASAVIEPLSARSIALAVLVSILWGGNLISIRIGVDSVPPLWSAFWRMALGVVIVGDALSSTHALNEQLVAALADAARSVKRFYKQAMVGEQGDILLDRGVHQTLVVNGAGAERASHVLNVSVPGAANETLLLTLPSLLALGWMMGGTVGLGTVLFSLLIGPSMERGLRVFGALPPPPAEP